MTAASILEVLWAQGFTVSLVDYDYLAVSPSSTLHETQWELLRANKAEIVAFLIDAKTITAALIKAAMLACDHFNDSSADRADMKRECIATPLHLQADLLNHFTKTY
jgi:hypothetical protein